MANNYYDNGSIGTGSYIAVTPTDTASAWILTSGLPTRCLNVAVSGTVTVIERDGNTVQLYLVAGYLHRVSCVQVKATGTAATGIVAGF
jgi:hypothetical protein